MRGKFIVIEGGDGTGKTTLCKRIMREFYTLNVRAVYTQEPTGSVIGVIIRKIINEEIPEPSEKLMAYLFAADRHYHCNTIRHLLDTGHTVLCDRYVLSSVVYQGVSGKVSDEEILKLSHFALVPDLQVYLDVPLSCESLIKTRRQINIDGIFADKTCEYLNRYRSLVNSLDSPLLKAKVIDATNSCSNVFQSVWDEILTQFEGSFNFF